MTWTNIMVKSIKLRKVIHVNHLRPTSDQLVNQRFRKYRKHCAFILVLILIPFIVETRWYFYYYNVSTHHVLRRIPFKTIAFIFHVWKRYCLGKHCSKLWGQANKCSKWIQRYWYSIKQLDVLPWSIPRLLQEILKFAKVTWYTFYFFNIESNTSWKLTLITKTILMRL